MTSDDLTIAQVAKASGLSRVTIYKCIDRGELSASVNHVNGVKTVSRSEFARFMSGRSVKPEQSTNSQSVQLLTDESVKVLQERVKGLEAQLKDKEMLIEEQRKRLLLLEDLRNTQSKEQIFAPEAQHETQLAPKTFAPEAKSSRPRSLLERITSAVKAGLEG